MTVDNLKFLNPNLSVFSVNDPEFLKFGRVLYGFNTKEIVNSSKSIEMPNEGSIYEASTEKFEKLEIAKEIAYKCFGEMPTQIGYCYGHSNYLNGWEWHTSSEINIATTDLVLILGDVRDLKENKIDSSNAKAVLPKNGNIIEVYSTTLHFCPCEVENTGFGCVVCLPKGTNLPLEAESDEKLLFRKNKWIIAHNENDVLINRGVKKGISGINIEIVY